MLAGWLGSGLRNSGRRAQEAQARSGKANGVDGIHHRVDLDSHQLLHGSTSPLSLGVSPQTSHIPNNFTYAESRHIQAHTEMIEYIYGKMMFRFQRSCAGDSHSSQLRTLVPDLSTHSRFRITGQLQ